MSTALITKRTLRPENLDKVQLSHGSHSSRAKGVCAMEAIAWLAGEPHSDTPHCVCPSIAEIFRDWNDALPHDQRNHILKPLLLTALHTNQGEELERDRRTMAGDWLLHEGLRNWLYICGLPRQARQATQLPRLTRSTAQDHLQRITDYLKATTRQVETAHQQALRISRRRPDRYHSMHHLDESGFSVVTPASLPPETAGLIADIADNCAHTADIMGIQFAPTVERLQVSTAAFIVKMAKHGE